MDLRKMLNDINVDDKMISRGVSLTTVGKEKVARLFNVTVDDVEQMLTDLSLELQDDPLLENDIRYSYEKDILGNVSIHDSESGKSVNLTGSQSFQLLKKIERSGGEYQDVLANAFEQNYLFEISDQEDDNDIDIEYDRGTFNFPHKKGFVTAKYWVDKNNKFQLSIISYRDTNGEEITLSSSEKNELLNKAMLWVEKV